MPSGPLGAYGITLLGKYLRYGHLRSIALLADSGASVSSESDTVDTYAGVFSIFQAAHEWDSFCLSYLCTLQNLNHLRIQLREESDLINSTLEEEMLGAA